MKVPKVPKVTLPKVKKPEILTGIFGGKEWYQSLTAWGAILTVAVVAGADAGCEAGLLSSEACYEIASYGKVIGPVLVALGIRKATNS